MSAYNTSLLKCSDKVGGVVCNCSDCPVMCPAKPVVLPNKGSLKITFILLEYFGCWSNQFCHVHHCFCHRRNGGRIAHKCCMESTRS